MYPIPINLFVYLRLICLFALALCLFNRADALPESSRAYSRIVYNKPDWSSAQVFTVEEFSNQADWSVMLKVKDDRSTNPEFRNYYRIGSGGNSGYTSFIIEFDSYKNECKFIDIDQWLLQGMTNILKMLTTTKDGSIKSNDAKTNTIGPMALLEYILKNAGRFKFVDHNNDSGESYFASELSVSEQQTLRIVASVSRKFFEKNEKNILQQGKVKFLADLNLDELHSMKASFVLVDSQDYKATCYYGALLKTLNGVESLHVTFMAIQGRDVSKHQGLAAFEADEENPFTLPTGAGCGSRGQLFHLNAKQFSGLFTRQHSDVQQFIAFDGRTNHLRLDRVGESKTIYDFGSQKSAIYVANDVAEGRRSISTSGTKNKCASVLFADQTSELGLNEVRSMADVIGFDSGVGLNYLGSETLEDGIHCLVFERELNSLSKIPLLAKLNMNIQARAGDRHFLTFYFVDEFKESKENAEKKLDRNNDRDSSLLDSIWLKRIDLVAKMSILQNNVIISRVTFSQSAWNLEVWAEYERDRRSRNLHPVRTFDAIECRTASSSSDQAFELELIIEQTLGAKQRKETNSSQQQRDGIFSQAGDFEEAIMAFLTTTTRIPRSYFNQLELLLPEPELELTNQKSGNYKILASAKIVNPLESQFQIQSKLLGWVKAYDEIVMALKDNVVLLQSDDNNNNRYECAMNVATSLDKGSMTMLFCPHNGCGYVKDFGAFSYIRANIDGENRSSSVKKPSDEIPTVSNYYHLCEIHSLKRMGLPVGLSNKFNAQTINSQLMSAKFSMKNMLGRNLLDSSTIDDFTGNVIKISVVDEGHHHDGSQSLGELMRAGYCFGEKMLANENDSGSEESVKSIQLTFEPHQSSAIYCHKACLLHPNCQTYSYSSVRRVCTLTNLPKSEINPGFVSKHGDKLTKDPSCRLFGLSALRLYTNLKMSLITSLAGLFSTNQYYFTSATKEACASLCHDNELNAGHEDERCRGFKYFSVSSMCVIEDKKSHLYRKQVNKSDDDASLQVDKVQYFKRFLSDPRDWDEINQCQFYERDYMQYYDQKSGAKFATDKDTASEQNNQRESLKLTELKTLYDIDSIECLRECTIIESNCIMADHCFHPINGIPTRYCSMYQLSGKLEQTTGSTSAGQLTQTIFGNIKLANIPSCNNYRLVDDYLMLKDKISQSNSNRAELKEISAQDTNRSLSYLHELDNLEQTNFSGKGGGSDFGFWSATLLLLIGSISGVLMAHFTVETPRILPTIELVSNSGSSGNSTLSSGSRLTQVPLGDMQVRPEFNELLELYES